MTLIIRWTFIALMLALLASVLFALYFFGRG